MVIGQFSRQTKFYKVNGSGFHLDKSKTAQQSVQPTGGIRPDLQAFFWLRVFSALEASLVPPTSG
jgi:hypothetical protein